MTTLDEQLLTDLGDLTEDGANEEPKDRNESLESNGNANTVEDVTRIAFSARLRRVMALLDGQAEQSSIREGSKHSSLVVECNELVVEIDKDLETLQKFIRDIYRTRYPELESLVPQPVDYARVVKAIGSDEDISNNSELDKILPAATVMVVKVTASTTSGRKLDSNKQESCMHACETAIDLEKEREKLIKFIEEKMNNIAPNMCEVVGAEVAARLMAAAGSIDALSRMPSSNLQVLGRREGNMHGMSSVNSRWEIGDIHAGLISSCRFVRLDTPPAFRKRALRLVSNKCSLMARIDASGGLSGGAKGREAMEEMRRKMDKEMAAPPSKIVKPMKQPEDDSRKKRGGRRKRKHDEAYASTEMRKAANRVGFNQPEEDFGQDEVGEGMGQLGPEDGLASGKQRITGQKSRKLAVAASKYQQRNNKRNQTGTYTSAASSSAYGSQATGTSSVAMTPVQGIELANPRGRSEPMEAGSGTDSVFSSRRNFDFSKLARDLKR